MAEPTPPMQAVCIEHEVLLNADGTCPKCRDANGKPFILDMQSYYLRPAEPAGKLTTKEALRWAQQHDDAPLYNKIASEAADTRPAGAGQGGVTSEVLQQTNAGLGYPFKGGDDEWEIFANALNQRLGAARAANAEEVRRLREALNWCLQNTDGHKLRCNLNQQSLWDEAQQALNDCPVGPDTAHAQAEINAKRNRCTCGYWDGLKRAEDALVTLVTAPQAQPR